MSSYQSWKFRILRQLGRIITRTAALLTLGRMPPFVSASAIIIDGEQILAVVDPIKNEAVLPGGHLRWTERPILALVREVREETGYTVKPNGLVNVWSGDGLSSEFGNVRIIYAAIVESGSLTSSGEGEAVWMPITEFMQAETRDAPIVRDWMTKNALGQV